MPLAGQLPTEVIHAILAELPDARSFFRAGQVSRSWRQATRIRRLAGKYLSAGEEWDREVLLRQTLAGIEIQKLGCLHLDGLGAREFRGYVDSTDPDAWPAQVDELAREKQYKTTFQQKESLSVPTLSPDGSLLAIVYTEDGRAVRLAVYRLKDGFELCGIVELAELLTPDEVQSLLSQLTVRSLELVVGHPDEGPYDDVDMRGTVLVAFSPDNTYVGVAVQDKMIQVWRVLECTNGSLVLNTTVPVYSETSPGDVRQLYLSPRGEVVFTRRFHAVSIHDTISGDSEVVGLHDSRDWPENVEFDGHGTISVDWPVISVNFRDCTLSYGYVPPSHRQHDAPPGKLFAYVATALENERSEILRLTSPRWLRDDMLIGLSGLEEHSHSYISKNGTRSMGYPVCLQWPEAFDRWRMPTIHECIDSAGEAANQLPPSDDEFENLLPRTRVLGHVLHDRHWALSPCKTRLALASVPEKRLRVLSLAPELLEPYFDKALAVSDPGLSVELCTDGLREVVMPQRDRVLVLYNSRLDMYRLTPDQGPIAQFHFKLCSDGGLLRMTDVQEPNLDRICTHWLGSVCPDCQKKHCVPNGPDQDSFDYFITRGPE